MRPDQPMTLWTRMKRAALGFDAWLNSSLFDSGRGLGDVWESYSRNVNRLKVRGAWRVVLDLTSEATTLGVAGGIVMLGLAIPAFRETSDDWLKTQELAVTFLDRYGQEIGRRGIRHDDSYKLEEFPDYLVKAALATEDRRFYEHWGIDPIGTFRALDRQRPRRRRRAGRLLDHPAARQEPVPDERALARAQDQGSLPRALARVPPDQGRDPQALSRPRLYGRRHARRRGGGRVLFRQVGQGPDARRIRHARRPVQGADEIRPAHQPAGGPRPRQRRPLQHGRGRLPDRGPDPDGAPQPGDAGQSAAATRRPTSTSTGPSSR